MLILFPETGSLKIFQKGSSGESFFKWRSYRLFTSGSKDIIPVLQAFLSRPAESRVLKSGPKLGSFEYRTGERKIFIKVRYGDFFRPLLELFRTPWALRILDRYKRFEASGLSTLIPLGGWVAVKPWDKFYSGLCFEYLPWEYKASFICRHFKERGREILLLLVQYLYRMHEEGFTIRDPKLSNFFVLGKKVILVDLDSLRYFSRPVEFARRIRDLEVLARSLGRVGWENPEKLVRDLYFALL